jgi:hypothetical protein
LFDSHEVVKQDDGSFVAVPKAQEETPDFNYSALNYARNKVSKTGNVEATKMIDAAINAYKETPNDSTRQALREVAESSSIVKDTINKALDFHVSQIESIANTTEKPDFSPSQSVTNSMQSAEDVQSNNSEIPNSSVISKTETTENPVTEQSLATGKEISAAVNEPADIDRIQAQKNEKKAIEKTVSSPYSNPPVSAHDLKIGQHFVSGSNSKAKQSGKNYEFNLPKSVYRVEKISDKSLSITDVDSGETYRVQKNQLNSDKPLDTHVLTDEQLQTIKSKTDGLKPSVKDEGGEVNQSEAVINDVIKRLKGGEKITAFFHPFEYESHGSFKQVRRLDKKDQVELGYVDGRFIQTQTPELDAFNMHPKKNVVIKDGTHGIDIEKDIRSGKFFDFSELPIPNANTKTDGIKFSKTSLESTLDMKSSEAGIPVEDRKVLKSAILKKLNSQYKDNPKLVKSKNGDDILVAWNGIKHAMNAGLPTWQEAIAALHIENLIENADLLEVRPDKLGRKDPATTTLYQVEANFDGVPNTVTIFVKNHSDGNRYYDHVTIENSPVGLTESEKNDSSSPTLPYAGDSKSINQSKTSSTNQNTYTKESLSSELKRVADEAFGKGWFARLLATGKFKIIDSTEAKAFTKETGVQAFYHNGTTYFVADGIASKTDLVGLLKHEISIHALKMGKDDAGFQSILKQIESMRGKNAAVDKAFKSAERAGTSKADLLEEVAGYLVEQSPELKLTQRLLAWFRNAIRKLTGDRFANNLTVNDLNYMAREALRNAPSELVLDAVEPMGMKRSANEKLLAPNGKPSNLNAMQHAQVRTPEFKAWFGDWENDAENASKVVDDNGEPLVVYHGTNKAESDFYEFSHDKYKSGSGQNEGGQMFFFTPSLESAKGYSFLAARNNGLEYDQEKGWQEDKYERIIESFINLRNPIMVESIDDQVASQFKRNKENDGMVRYRWVAIDEDYENFNDDNWKKEIAELGIDNSNQIKSATENTGAFDSSNNDIRYSKTEPNVTFADTQGKPTDDDYTKNRELTKSTLRHVKETARRFGDEIVHGTGSFLGGARTRLENISAKLGAKYIGLERNIATHESRTIKAVQPFMAKTKTMNKADAADFDYAMKNADSAKLNELVDKYQMRAEYDAVRATLDQLREDAIDTGLAIGKIEDYFPRVLRDSKGMLNAMGKGDDFPVFTRRIREYAADLGVSYNTLSDDLKAELINSMIENNYNGMGGLSATKSRKFEKIPAELNQFYLNSNAAMLQHIHNMVKHIEYRKFLGHIPKKVASIRHELGVTQAEIKVQSKLMHEATTEDAKESARQKRNELIGTEKQLEAYLSKYLLQRDYKENIATYIMKLIADGEIQPHQERIVQEVLNARLHEHGATGAWAAYKNLALIDTMGSPISAITQIGDFTWALYEGGGLFGGLKAISKAFRKDVVFDRTDYGLERIAQEFTESDTFAGAVDKVFGLVGIKAITGKASDSLLNAISDKLTRQANANDANLLKKLETYFENDANQVLSDLKNGVINDNTRLMIYSRYLDFAPVTLSELPIKYQTSGNGRVFYMLKSYTLKLFDVYRREAVKEIFSGDKQRAIQGMKNLTMILALLMLTGAGADELKDYILGRNTDFDDRVTDNLWKLAGLSKFITWQVRREGLGTAAFKQIMPPFAFVNAVGNDIIHATDINRHPKNEMWVNGLDTTNSIPVVGKWVWWRYGRGQQAHKELSEIRFKKEMDNLKDVKDEFEQLEGDEKKRFYIEHKAEFGRLKQAGHVQASANRIKEIINKQRAQPKSDAREAVISKLEKQRDSVISRFVGMS